MRSRRLPLGSPSRKEKSETSASTTAPAATTSRSNNNETTASRVRTRQAPPAIRSKDSTTTNTKRLRRTNRGLPLSSSAGQASTTAKSPPNTQPVSQNASKEVVEEVVHKKKEVRPSENQKSSNESTAKREFTSKPDESTKVAATSVKKKPVAKANNINSSSTLFAVRPDGSQVKMKLLVHGKEYSLNEKNPNLAGGRRKGNLGNDGNQFNCESCGGFGDVVCCDGCPKVYHPECIPVSSDPLNNDDEPWFCPSCSEERKGSNKTTTTAAARVTRRSSVLQESSSTASSNKVAAAADGSGFEDDEQRHCDACGKTTDMPYYNEKGDTLCAECFAAEADGEPANEADDAMDVAYSEEPTAQSSKRPERKRKATYLEEEEKEKLPSKKKKKKKKVHRDSIDTSEPAPEAASLPIPAGAMQAKPGIAQATPAFYFYLVENKAKIERVLARRHRSFSRLNKAGEKNALIAKEAAIWWSRLRPPDQKRYISMSMRDFEGRIIEWKEDKSIQEMNSNSGAMYDRSTRSESTLVEEDEKLTWKRHQRLYLSTSVGSKPFKPEPDQAYNRVLQDLLHDMRFHPLPMLGTSRPEHEEQKDDMGSKALIPYFDVHGPASTSVGDACIGCMRSWNHFCPVLQRRVPAVEHRARLQPPISSLLATRVGLGLRPHLTRLADEPTVPDEESELMTWRTSKQREDMMHLPIVPSSSLSAPNERMDDIVLFVEETTAMKVPEPSRPEINQKSQLRSLPLQSSKVEDGLFKKCGRCRTIIQGDTGCVQCRRAQLVINMAKRQKHDGKLLKVHTSMLGRYNTKEAPEAQSDADEAVAGAMLKERWTPTAVLPAVCMYAPNPVNKDRRVRSTTEKESQKPGEEVNEEPVPACEHDTEKPPGKGDSTNGQDRETRDRPSRVVAVSHDIFEPHERQEIMEKNRKAVNSFHKKVVLIACAGMLQALVRRDPLKLFDQPVTDDAYYDVIKQPIFSAICERRS